MNNPWVGSGVFIWLVKQCVGDMGANSVTGRAYLVETLKRYKCYFNPIKVADGVNRFNLTPQLVGYKDDIVGPLLDLMEQAGMPRVGWHYVYGYSPRREAEVAVQQIKDRRLTHFIVDAESEYKFKAAQAKEYMNYVMTACPDVHYGLCSFRFPSYHPEFPWGAFLERMRDDMDAHVPMVYWEQVFDPPYTDNPGKQMERSYRELMNLKSMTVMPVGPAYGVGQPGSQYWAPSLAQMDNFIDTTLRLGCPGITWWRLGVMMKQEFLDRGYLDLVRDTHDKIYGTTPTPPPILTIEEKVERMWRAHPELHNLK